MLSNQCLGEEAGSLSRRQLLESDCFLSFLFRTALANLRARGEDLRHAQRIADL
jgi:hypothetical protein